MRKDLDSLRPANDPSRDEWLIWRMADPSRDDWV